MANEKQYYIRAGTLGIDFERGRIDIDRETIKGYDAQGRLLWFFAGDTFTVPKDSPILSAVNNVRELLDRGAVVGVRFEEGLR